MFGFLNHSWLVNSNRIMSNFVPNHKGFFAPCSSAGLTRSPGPTRNCRSISYVVTSDGNSKKRGRVTVAEGGSLGLTGL